MRFLQLHRTYAACLLAALALGASCTKTVYDEGQQTQSPAISLSVTEAAQTRAMIDNTNFGTDGNRIQVYDFWTDGNTVSKYIDAYAGPEVDNPSSQHIERTTWPFVDKSSGELVRYNWTSTGVHKFFGWLAVDATTKDGSKNMTAESFFGEDFKNAFNETSKVLTIPAKTLDQSTPQFDFLYSDIKTVKVTNGVPENVTVPMSFSHLFAAVSFGAKNTSNSVVKLLEFRVEKLFNAKSATIDFSDSAPSVEYADGTRGGVFRRVAYSDAAAAVTVPKDGSGTTMYNIFGNPGDEQEFTLIWPQTINQLHSTDLVTEDTDGNPVYPVSYKMFVSYTVDGVPFTKRINFDNTLAWEAGKKYHYDIIFADKMVELKCVVNPWEYVSEDINFENQTVSVKEGSTLSWVASESEVDDKNLKVAIKDNKPAVGTFTLDTPKGGRWFAYLSGDVDAFKIIDGEGPVGTPAIIQVQPVVDSPLRDYVVKVHFIVRTADGKTLDADSVLQPKVYSIILPKNK